MWTLTAQFDHLPVTEDGNPSQAELSCDLGEMMLSNIFPDAEDVLP